MNLLLVAVQEQEARICWVASSEAEPVPAQPTPSAFPLTSGRTTLGVILTGSQNPGVQVPHPATHHSS